MEGGNNGRYHRVFGTRRWWEGEKIANTHRLHTVRSWTVETESIRDRVYPVVPMMAEITPFVYDFPTNSSSCDVSWVCVQRTLYRQA